MLKLLPSVGLSFLLCLLSGLFFTIEDAAAQGGDPNSFWPSQCRQRGGNLECEPIGTHEAWRCGENAQGSFISGETPNACRDAYLQALNASSQPTVWKAQADAGGDCDLSAGPTGTYYQPPPPGVVVSWKMAWVAQCWLVPFIGDSPSGARNLMFTRTVGSCPEGTTIAARLGGNGLEPICMMPVLTKNTGDCPDCKTRFGNPIFLGTGNKYQRETDYVGQGIMPLMVVRHFNSLPSAFSSSLSVGWKFDFERRILVHRNTAGLPLPSVSVERRSGPRYLFRLVNGAWVTDGDINDRLTEVTDALGVRTGWMFYDAQTDRIEHYSADGTLQMIKDRNGNAQTYTYSTAATPAAVAPWPGLLIEITDPQSRSLLFDYGPSGRIESITLPSGELLAFSFDSQGRLNSVTYPGAASRTYHYEASLSPAPGRTNLLTGITDGNQSRLATFVYNAWGAAVETSYAGGVNKYAIAGGSNPQVVTDPKNSQRSYSWSYYAGIPAPSVVQQPCGTPGCSGQVSEYFNYDGNRNLTSRIDFNGVTRAYTYDTTRNLMGTDTRASGRAEQLRTTKEWHPTERVAKRISEPRRRTTYKYHLEAGISCAPATAAPTLVCEKRLEATVDANGMSGFGASLDATVPARVWTWTYNAQGQMLTATDPRNNITTYTYHPATTTDVTQGDLASITNAKGHITQFTRYNKHGQPLEIIDPNGLVTTLTYHPRQWLLSRTVGSNTATPETTTYTYDNVGQLTRATQPDGSFVQYHNDAAHRLWKIEDTLGNSITYTLDNMGNRTGETYKDPAGTLARTLTREYDALNRLKFDKGGSTPQPVTEYGYDNLGNLKKITDPLTRVTDNDYDALNRLIKVTDPQSPTRGVTEYGYDGQDNLTSVKDPKGLTTTYTYNGLGDLKAQVSPDTGTTNFTHDVAGNVLTKSDARSVTATYTYDALNRVDTIAYPAVGTDPAETVTYTYDTCTHGKGRLCQITDKTGTTTYTYDLKGRVTAKSQTHGSLTQTVGYGYNAPGQLTTITYPSGRVVTYTYTNGRPVSVAVNGKTVLTSAVYEPFGPLGGWHWGNSTPQAVNAHLRVFDLDYRAISVQSDHVGMGPRVRDLTWNLASAITAITEPGNPQNSYTYGYDTVDRLTGVTPQGQSQKYAYSYDLNGNRLSSTDTGATTNYSYPSPFTSHRLTGLTGSQVKTFSYDAVGNMTGDGLNTWRYGGNNRPHEVVTSGGTVSVAINALGQRIKKAAGANVTRFVYDEAGRLIGEYTDAGTRVKEHVWLGDLPVAVIP